MSISSDFLLYHGRIFLELLYVRWSPQRCHLEIVAAGLFTGWMPNDQQPNFGPHNYNYVWTTAAGK